MTFRQTAYISSFMADTRVDFAETLTRYLDATTPEADLTPE